MTLHEFDKAFAKMRFGTGSSFDGAGRAALLQPEGKASLITLRLRDFDAAHPTKALARAVSALATRQAVHSTELANLDRTIARTRPTLTLTLRERVADRPRIDVIEAMVGFLLALIAFGGSNIVLGKYVKNSSGADLFSDDPVAGAIFALTPLLIAGAVKAFERRLETDAARLWYGWIFFGLGISGAALWSFMAALVFAPDIGTAGSFLMASGSNRTSVITLVLAHVIMDVALGYVLFSTAERLILGNCITMEVLNPRHTALVSARISAIAASETCRHELGRSEDELASILDEREAVRIRAEFEYETEAELSVEGQQLFLSLFSLLFHGPRTNS